jgi:hypothetical protein
MARGSQGPPEVLLGAAMPDASKDLRVGHPKTALQHRWPAAVFYPLGYPMPYGPAEESE